MVTVRYCLNALTRRKPIDQTERPTKLNRCLTTLDLTALGIGSTLGLGVYVLAGQVASLKAGPSVTLSFLIAAIASVFAGLCYAEFGARVPKAGSAYVYSYVCVGEFVAFIIGWNLILEYVIGTASVARGYSGYIDSLLNNTIKNHLHEWMPIDVNWISNYPDFFAFGITLLLTVMLTIGVKESTRFNTIFTSFNLVVVLYSLIVGSFKIDFKNWRLSKESVESVAPKGGKGGFFPFGVKGMLSGAATCFYGFVGFDAIATTGEEVLNPQKSIPISITFSLFIITLAYSGISAIQTLMWPYYDQNNGAPLPYVFEKVGYPVAKWIISIGALAGLSTSLLGAMFPLPRVLYAMASDRLIFKFLANVHHKFKTPVIATILSGILAAVMAALFDVSQLADMMSIGTLLAYTLVALSVLILRYQEESPSNASTIIADNDSIDECYDSMSENTNSINKDLINSKSSGWRQLLNSDSSLLPSLTTSKISLWLIVGICCNIVVLNILLVMFDEQLYSLNLPIAVLVLIIVFTLIIIIGLIVLGRQPTIQKNISFKVPFVPLIPMLSIFANTNLMLQLSVMTWYRFVIWMSIGFFIYFFYGIVKSIGYLTEDEKRRLSISGCSNSSDSLQISNDFNENTDDIKVLK